MEVDHIFIFSSARGEEANSLKEFGLTEGSSRLHPGQGTTNRKFYFENFFLEILWVVNEKEIQSELTAPTKLWERSQFENNEHSPFGLCLVNTASTDQLFETSKIYQPNYFPEGMSIDIIPNEEYPKLPWTFRLPYRGEQKPHTEPTGHANQIKRLTRVEFEIPLHDYGSEFANYFQDVDLIEYTTGNRMHLTLEFDNMCQGKSREFFELNLTIKY